MHLYYVKLKVFAHFLIIYDHLDLHGSLACTLLLFRRDLDVIILFFIRFKQYSLRFFFFTLVRMIRNKQQASTRPTLDSIFQISILYISSRNNLDFVHRFHFRHGVHVSAMFFFSVWLFVFLFSILDCCKLKHPLFWFLVKRANLCASFTLQ